MSLTPQMVMLTIYFVVGLLLFWFIFTTAAQVYGATVLDRCSARGCTLSERIAIETDNSLNAVVGVLFTGVLTNSRTVEDFEYRLKLLKAHDASFDPQPTIRRIYIEVWLPMGWFDRMCVRIHNHHFKPLLRMEEEA